MTKLIIVTLVVIAGVVALVRLRRRPMSEELETLDRRSDEQRPSEDTQGSQLAASGLQTELTPDKPEERSAEAPHEPTGESPAPAQTHKTVPMVSETVEPASAPRSAVDVGSPDAQPPVVAGPLPALYVEPVPALPTLPYAASPATSASTTREQTAGVLDPGQTEPGPAPPPVSSLGREEIAVPPDAPKSEPFLMKAEAPTSVSQAAAGLSEPAAETAIAHEKCGHVGALLDKRAAVPASATQTRSGEAELRPTENPEISQAGTDQTLKPPTYRPPRPPAPPKNSSGGRERSSGRTPGEEAELRVRLRLRFGRSAMSLTLVPHWRTGMPDELDITGTQGELRLVKSSGCYEDVSVVDASTVLREGVAWRGHGGARRWRWSMSERELYVLTSGDVGGLYPFGSSARLVLRAKHVLLTTVRLRDDVEAALKAAGCHNFTTLDEASGVPAGWLLFRDVVPTVSVAQLDERHILNPLCPGHEIEAHFIGGIRLKHHTWLASHPPRVRLSGPLGSGFKVTIGGQIAQEAADGSLEAPGWNMEGRHRLEFGQKPVMYALVTMHENWKPWHAHNFGTGAAICGASVQRIDGARWRQFCIPAGSPLVIGARPGEVFRCRVPTTAHTEWILAPVPFTPVWALPSHRLPKKSCSSALVLLRFTEPLNALERPLHKVNATSALRQWVFAIRNARRNRFGIAVQSSEAEALWRRYGDVAKRLRKRCR